jgi:hypothetical protein
MHRLHREMPIPSFRPADQPGADVDSNAVECDWCGKLVPPGTAVERAGGDGEVVVLCTACEFGAD